MTLEVGKNKSIKVDVCNMTLEEAKKIIEADIIDFLRSVKRCSEKKIIDCTNTGPLNNEIYRQRNA